ncbi:MAG: tetratricopeptide repeat protein [Pseudomonadota bacterium]
MWRARQWLAPRGWSLAAQGVARAQHANLRALVAAEPARADLRRELSVSLHNLGNLAIDAGRGDEARRFFEESLQVMRDLVGAEPNRADLRRDLAIFQWNFYLLVTSRAERIAWLRAVLATLTPLRAAGVQDAQVAQLWGFATNALRKRGEKV